MIIRIPRQIRLESVFELRRVTMGWEGYAKCGLLEDLDDELRAPLMPWPPSDPTEVGDLEWRLELGLPVPWRVHISGDGAAPTADGFWWTTIGELGSAVEGFIERASAAALALVSDLPSGFITAWLSEPVAFKSERDRTMRWLRSTIRGTLHGVEQWQFKMDFGNPGSDPTTDEATALGYATEIAGLWSDGWAAHMATQYNAGVVTTEVGVAELTQTEMHTSPSTGHQEFSYATQWFSYVSTARPAGTATQQTLPFEVAMCVSLHTEHRGPSGRGRLYLPPPTTANIGAGGVWASGVPGIFGGVIGDLFDGFTALHSTLHPVVVSPRRQILNAITHVDVGLVPDSQRRRRRSQVEAPVLAWSV
jgi:hypothetical protein